MQLKPIEVPEGGFPLKPVEIDSSIFNLNKTDYQTKSLFLGQRPGLFDTINKTYPQIWDNYKTMKSLDWDENEFPFGSCMAEFESEDPRKVRKMIYSLAWQWEADSVASRSISHIVSLFDPASELWAAWQRISDNECLIEGTEVLTPTGWVDLAYINLQSSVAQYNPVDGSIEFVNPTNFIAKPFNGKLIEFRNHQKHFHQVVTPGHRMIKKKGATGEWSVEEAATLDYQKGTAGDLVVGLVSGKSVGKNNNLLSPLERLLIAIQADGTVSGRYDGSRVGTIPVWFGFAKSRKVDRLLEITKELGFEVIELTGSEQLGNKAPQRRFKVNVPLEYSQHLKNFDWVNLEDKGVVWCKDFLDELVHWDGHHTKNTGILHTTSRQAVEVAQAVGALCGMKTHLGFYPDNRKESFNGCWRLSWKEQEGVSGQGITKTEVDYQGTVRCITVPTGFFLMRYQDSVSITGNCVHGATYSEIVRASFRDPRKVLEEVLGIVEAHSRLAVVANEFGWIRRRGLQYQLGDVPNDQETYNAIFMFTFMMFVLERLQFMSSFVVTFALGTENSFMPACKAIQKIAQDEFEVHVELDRMVLNNELQTERGKIAYQQLKPRMQAVYDAVINAEVTWLKDVLWSDGYDLEHLNLKQAVDWVYWCGLNVARPLGLEVTHPVVDRIPVHYMKTWLNISDIQASPQEEANGQYKVGIMERDDEDVEFVVDF